MVTGVSMVTGVFCLTTAGLLAQPDRPPTPREEPRARDDDRRPERPLEDAQPLTTEQKATVKTILSKYKPETLTASDAKAINEAFRAAGLRNGPGLAGRDPRRRLRAAKNRRTRSAAEPPRGADGSRQAVEAEATTAPSDRRSPGPRRRILHRSGHLRPGAAHNDRLRRPGLPDRRPGLQHVPAAGQGRRFLRLPVHARCGHQPTGPQHVVRTTRRQQRPAHPDRGAEGQAGRAGQGTGEAADRVRLQTLSADQGFCRQLEGNIPPAARASTARR